MLLAERESEIRFVKFIALDQPADADRLATFGQANEVETEAVRCITTDGSVAQILVGILLRPNALVTDERHETGLVEQGQNKCTVVTGQPFEPQSFRCQHVGPTRLEILNTEMS